MPTINQGIKKTFALLMIVFIVFGLFSSSAFAILLASQTDSSTQMTSYANGGSTGRRNIQSLGTGYNNGFYAVEVSVKSNINSEARSDFTLVECPSSTFDIDTVVGPPDPTSCAIIHPTNSTFASFISQPTVSPHNVQQSITFTFDYWRRYAYNGGSSPTTTGTGAYALDNSKYYFLMFTVSSATQYAYHYGSTADNFAGGQCYLQYPSDGSPLTSCSEGILDLYFIVYDGSPNSPLNYPYVPLSPLTDEQVPNNFAFVGKINNQGGAYSFKLKVWGVTNATYSHEKTFIIPSTGAINYTYSQLWDFLPDGDYEYTWRFCDEEGDCTPYWSDYTSTPKIQFEVLEGATSPFPVEDFVECATFEMFCHLKNFSIWLFGITDETLYKFSTLTLEDRQPFSYLYEVDDLYQDLFNQTSSELGISFTTTAWGTVTLISADLLEDVPFQGMILTILSSILWFFTVMTIYNRVTRVYASS